MRSCPTPSALSSPLGVLAILVGRCPGVRAHADLVASQLQHGPATAADLQRAVADPKHLGLALALLREMGAIDVTPGQGHLVYQLADGLLGTPEGMAGDRR